MRNRKEIENEIAKPTGQPGSGGGGYEQPGLDSVILEVLLDIRDLITKETKE